MVDLDLYEDVQKEKPEYSLPEFLSDIGGTFGLFLGISIASIVESVSSFYCRILTILIFLFELKKLISIDREFSDDFGRKIWTLEKTTFVEIEQEGKSNANLVHSYVVDTL